MEQPCYVYIMTNKHNTVLYTGVTNNLAQRIWEHKNKNNPKSFTAKYNICKLVYYEGFDLVTEGITREKQIKGGSREKKLALVNSLNPEWKDLFEEDVRHWSP